MVHYVNWWCSKQDAESSENNQDGWFSRFFTRACEDWNMPSDAIKIFSVFGNPQHLLAPRASKDEIRIFFSGENLFNMHQHYNNLQLVEPNMDIILGFSFFGSSSFYYFPLWLIYWDFWSRGCFQPQINVNKNDKAILVASHTAGGIRTFLCEHLHQLGLKIDVNRSTLFNQANEVVYVPDGVKHKRNVLSNYKYNLCPENSVSDGYTTEKMFESLAAGCIPLYIGTPPKPELDVINEEYIVQISPNTTLTQIQGTKQPDLDMWKPDALSKIFTKHAVLWVKVWSKMRQNGEYNRKNANILLVDYSVTSTEEAFQQLQTHWNTYQNLFTPRATFMFRNGVRKEWEEIVATLFL